MSTMITQKFIENKAEYKREHDTTYSSKGQLKACSACRHMGYTNAMVINAYY
jgi:hypothetical protein